MSHDIHRVTDFEQIGTYTLRVEFEDGLRRVIDFEPVLHGGLFEALHDPALFSRVQLDSEVWTLVWPNGADFDPATLHQWPEIVEDLAERARAWRPARVAS
jgi:hypothetical protein